MGRRSRTGRDTAGRENAGRDGAAHDVAGPDRAGGGRAGGGRADHDRAGRHGGAGRALVAAATAAGLLLVAPGAASAAIPVTAVHTAPSVRTTPAVRTASPVHTAPLVRTASSVGAVGRQVVAPQVPVPAGARAAGALPAGRTVTGAVALRPRDATGLQAFATAVSTPGSPDRGRYLTPAAFTARFGPSPATVAAVERQLTSSGLAVTSVSADRLLVDFQAPAARVAAAFGTRLEQYRLAGGRTAFSPTSALTLPAAVAPSVQAVLGLSDTLQAHASLSAASRPAASRPAASRSAASRPAASRSAASRPVASRPPAASSLGPRRGGVSGHRAAVAPALRQTAPAGSPVACGAAAGAAEAYGGLTDTAIADAYGVGGLYRAGDVGSGQTVAIFELEPFDRPDVAAFDSCYFGSRAAGAMLARLHTTAVTGGQQRGSGSGEAILDVEDVSAVAPGATIDVYEAPNTVLGTVDDYAAIVDAGTAKVVSTSWGFCEQALQLTAPGTQQVENTLFEQAASQGQSVFAAAGDAGSDDCAETGPKSATPYLSVDDPESQPFVISAGGTTITDATQPPAEQVWNDGPAGGAGGGGYSDTWARPSWQAASAVPGINDRKVLAAAATESGATPSTAFCLADPAARATATGCREVPDVSAQADEFTGAVTVDYAGQWTTFGGTSSAAPLWAGMLTEVNASRSCLNDAPTAHGVGFASPSLYAVASVPAEYAASFTDVTTGNNDGYGISGGLYPATRGYDMASGLGSPELTGPGGRAGLAAYLCTAAASSRPSVSQVSPAAISGAATVHLTGQGFEVGGRDLVAGVQVGSLGLPAGDVHVLSPTRIDIDVTAPAAGSGGAPGGLIGDGNGTDEVIVTLVGGLSSPPTAASRLIVHGSGGSSSAAPEVDAVGSSGGPDGGGTTVTVYGSGLTGATQVTFGGVPATGVRVRDDGELTATAPALVTAGPGATVCAQPTDPTTDVCQVAVRVTTPAGTSPAGTILTPYAGSYALDPQYVPVTPPGCGCEIAPAATEYDYLPHPTITSVTSRPVGPDGRHYASERGNTVETIDGTGLGILGLEWVDVGPTDQASSEDVSFTYVSGTRIQVVLPAEPGTHTVEKVTLHVQTLGSPNGGNLSAPTPPSTPGTVLYAPEPVVSSVTTAGPLAAGPSGGGTTLTIHGLGLATTTRVGFTDERPGGYSSAQTTSVRVVSNTEVVVTTPSANPGTVDVSACGPSACSPRVHRHDTFIYYPPGAPSVTSIEPARGPAAGGNRVTIHGRNLGYVEAVTFGGTAAAVVPESSLLDSGSTDTIVVVVPSGRPGTRVAVRITTVESVATGSTPSPVTGASHYTYLR